jgi:hypothetical protein
MKNKYCKCYKVLSTRKAFHHLINEIKEFIDSPSLDELSDISFSINRLLGSLVNKKYVNLLNANRHINKINQRMIDNKCIRSNNHKSCII